MEPDIAEKDFKQHPRVASKARISTNTLEVENKGPKPKLDAKHVEGEIDLPPPGEVKELVVDPEQARAITGRKRALECEKPGRDTAQGRSSEAGGNGSDSRFEPRDIYRMEEFRAYSLQEKLLEYMGEGLFKLRHPKFLDEGMAYCDEIVIFEERRGYETFFNHHSPAAAARGLEILLKSLHRLGIVHLRVHLHYSFMWEPDNVDSLKLFDFFHARFFVDLKSGKVIDAKAPAYDLKDFANRFLPPKFLEAIETGFDYDYWISYFKQSPSF